MDEAQRMLDVAARLGLRGRGDVEPNPPVGCVVVADGRIIGMGHHRRFGGPHAEVEALADCRRRGLDPAGAHMYITLEPCRHHGKTPPCTDTIIRARIARVIVAARDPHTDSGGGMEILRAAGIEAVLCDASRTAVELSRPFAKRVRTGLPWVIAKWAQTIDGRIATRTGHSQWISCELSRRRVHRLRARVDAIVTGIGTVLADDPMLTARDARRVRRVARRVVVDRNLRIAPTCRLVRTASQVPLIVVCSEHTEEKRAEQLAAHGVEVVRLASPSGDRLDLGGLLRYLADAHGAANVLVEAGPGLTGSVLGQGHVDELRIYIAPLVLGDEQAPAAAVGRVIERLEDAERFELLSNRRVHQDVELVLRRAGA